MGWYLKVLKKYFVFRGRACRREYWMFSLVSFLITLLLALLHIILDLHFDIQGIYQLLVLIPAIALASRRLHDTGRTAWWLLLSIIPLIGWLILLFFFCKQGNPGENRFGPDPKTSA
ncbi:DUF805 domain-containing protein [Enterobacter cloacae complex sp. I2]|uniref:DUF805 domain-containing protein n=1 Tax=Enterobacter cloacae complex sp. I2 TaxID=2779603 RepID=UPI0018668A06|nr:DUF805 domain-containing protein [Enterobacter cloacae complex sp. I2]MBE3510633.1 DUF805 domain-containing protein [Enterobacter cloacae complex sp. I2]